MFGGQASEIQFVSYKAGVTGRKQGIWKSRTARTSTSRGGLIGSSFRNMFGLVYLYRESFLGNALGPECCFELSWITLVDKDVLFLVSRLEDGHF